jgi:hypothetical protein
MKNTESFIGKHKAEGIGIISGVLVCIIAIILRHVLNCNTTIIDSVPIAAGLYLMSMLQFPAFLDTVILFAYFMLLGFIFGKIIRSKRKVLFIVLFVLAVLIISAFGTTYIGYVLNQLSMPPVN